MSSLRKGERNFDSNEFAYNQININDEYNDE